MLLPILKANGKLKDPCIPFIWASRGFVLSRGLEIKPSGYGDKKERGRFSKTSTTTGKTVRVHLKTGLNNGPEEQQIKPTTSHLQYRLTWH